MKSAFKKCSRYVAGKWEKGVVDESAWDGGGARDTITQDPGWAWSSRIYFKNKFFEDSECEQKRVLLKECYLRVKLRNFDDTGIADNKNDGLFKSMECCLSCCGTVNKLDGKKGAKGCCTGKEEPLSNTPRTPCRETTYTPPPRPGRIQQEGTGRTYYRRSNGQRIYY